MTDLVVALSVSGRYLDWGVIHVSLANLLIVVIMVVVFVLALVVPFVPARTRDDRDSRPRP